MATTRKALRDRGMPAWAIDQYLEQCRQEDRIAYHLRRALEWSAQRFGRGEYHLEYIEGCIGRIHDDWLNEHPRPEPVYEKRPIPAGLRRKVFERDGYRCVTCGDWHDLSCDHIIPESKGGPATFENLQTLCRSCNSSKGART